MGSHCVMVVSFDLASHTASLVRSEQRLMIPIVLGYLVAKCLSPVFDRIVDGRNARTVLSDRVLKEAESSETRQLRQDLSQRLQPGLSKLTSSKLTCCNAAAEGRAGARAAIPASPKLLPDRSSS